MKKLSKYLLIVFSFMLAISGFLSSQAQDIRTQKEESIFFFIARVNILNTYYNIRKYNNEEHSLKNYQQMIKDQTEPITSKIESYNPKIKIFNNWATALLFISIIGNTMILVIETVYKKEGNNSEG